jgi:hypothetical protein
MLHQVKQSSARPTFFIFLFLYFLLDCMMLSYVLNIDEKYKHTSYIHVNETNILGAKFI